MDFWVGCFVELQVELFFGGFLVSMFIGIYMVFCVEYVLLFLQSIWFMKGINGKDLDREGSLFVFF